MNIYFNYLTKTRTILINFNFQMRRSLIITRKNYSETNF